MTIDIDPRNYNDVYYPYLHDNTRTQIFFGGSSSGKSVFLAERCVGDVLEGGRNYLILRNVANTLRTSVFNEVSKVIRDWGVSQLFRTNKNEMTITCVNGYQIIFKGLDDAEKLKSVTPEKGIITDAWVEEATETNYDDIKQLNKRLRGWSPKPKRLTLSFNPIMRNHWIFKEYFGGWVEGEKLYKDPGLLILKTTHVDNAFLTREDHEELENEKDQYYREVYTLGNWGVLGNVIFTNWRVADLSDIRDMLSVYRNGLDFGFTNDPSAFVRTARKGNILYITHGFYEYGLTNPDIARRILEITPNAHSNRAFEAVRCDSAEPKSIHELRQHSVNAISAIKGPGSVNYGIQLLKQYDEIVIHKELQPVVNEFQLYQWQKNKQGEVLNIPVDRDNHAIDAIRYSESDRLGGGFNEWQDPRKLGIA